MTRLFDPTEQPRLFAVGLGEDFPKSLVKGLFSRFEGQPPEALARIEILVNTRRMQRRLLDLLGEGTPRLLPRIRLLTELANDPRAGSLPPVAPPIQRRLVLSELVARLLDIEPDLAPRSAVFDLADSLARVLDEMQGEGVALDDLDTIREEGLSQHWQKSLRFLRLIGKYLELPDNGLDPEARQRRAIAQLGAAWELQPPRHPILLAGSTGSRGTTSELMGLVARLPQGAVILPGVDLELPDDVWARLDTPRAGEDHPQYRFASLMHRLDLSRKDLRHWTDPAPANAPRNRMVSLSMRPAPVTDQWLTEGPALQDLVIATDSMTLIEAPDGRTEALAIALRLRQAVADEKTAALISPDRVLTRQVAAALDRWRIVPDDSAGRPLAMSAPGRFLRHVAELFDEPMTPETLITLLKHPLCHSERQDRGEHLRRTRDLELHMRRNAPFFLSADALRNWGRQHLKDEEQTWICWICDHILGHSETSRGTVAEHLSRHLRTARILAAGPDIDGSGGLWLKEAGEKARDVVHGIEQEADAGGVVSAREYEGLFQGILGGEEVREAITAHPGVMIWGTLEARVQGADLVILGGLNDGVWPGQPAPDPWFSRQMRLDAGLLLPERRIGLSAHDFEQAVSAGEVVLTRATRNSDAETVPSRWLNRITNLLDGLGDEGKAVLKAMQARGLGLVEQALALERPANTVNPEKRPSPVTPVAHRPEQLSVTRIQTLVRDPYAIYASRILRLKPLDPLASDPDARLRGVLFHRILECFIDRTQNELPEEPAALLREIGVQVLEQEVPHAAIRVLWNARIAQFADWFVQNEAARRARGLPVALEVRGEAKLPNGFRLTGEADRIDRLEDSRIEIFDYKTGAMPSPKVVRCFDKQLFLEAAIAANGGFEGLDPETVAQVAYIGVGTKPEQRTFPLAPDEIPDIWSDFGNLIEAWNDPDRGYTARRAMQRLDDRSDYDHLSRLGEWSVTDKPVKERVE